ncbi:MAG: hypothetical protein NTW51_06555 [Cyanobacteria bacterium]|nr:hypothetical protein [Cyanobacteriota bacterium]
MAASPGQRRHPKQASDWQRRSWIGEPHARAPASGFDPAGPRLAAAGPTTSALAPRGWRPLLLWRGVEAGQWPHTLRSWLALLPLVLQQLHWWSVRVLRQALWRRRLRKRRPNATPLPPPLPRRLALAACWLNNFQSHEVRQWQTVGVGRWAELSTKLPDSHCGAFHSQRR